MHRRRSQGQTPPRVGGERSYAVKFSLFMPRLLLSSVYFFFFCFPTTRRKRPRDEAPPSPPPPPSGPSIPLEAYLDLIGTKYAMSSSASRPQGRSMDVGKLNSTILTMSPKSFSAATAAAEVTRAAAALSAALESRGSGGGGAAEEAAAEAARNLLAAAAKRREMIGAGI